MVGRVIGAGQIGGRGSWRRAGTTHALSGVTTSRNTAPPRASMARSARSKSSSSARSLSVTGARGILYARRAIPSSSTRSRGIGAITNHQPRTPVSHTRTCRAGGPRQVTRNAHLALSSNWSVRSIQWNVKQYTKLIAQARRDKMEA